MIELPKGLDNIVALRKVFIRRVYTLCTMKGWTLRELSLLRLRRQNDVRLNELRLLCKGIDARTVKLMIEYRELFGDKIPYAGNSQEGRMFENYAGVSEWNTKGLQEDPINLEPNGYYRQYNSDMKIYQRCGGENWGKLIGQ